MSDPLVHRINPTDFCKRCADAIPSAEKRGLVSAYCQSCNCVIELVNNVWRVVPRPHLAAPRRDVRTSEML